MISKNRIAELKQRATLAWAILRGRDGNLVKHALRETFAWRRSDDEMNREMARGLIDLVRVFGAQGHSGFSASYAASALAPLLRFEPIHPLNGDEDEWAALNYNSDMQAQNKRCGHVFRRADGSAYDGEAVVFREPNGSCFTGMYSRRDITFPYAPRRVYADVPFGASDEQKAAAADAAWSAA